MIRLADTRAEVCSPEPNSAPLCRDTTLTAYLPPEEVTGLKVSESFAVMSAYSPIGVELCAVDDVEIGTGLVVVVVVVSGFLAVVVVVVVVVVAVVVVVVVVVVSAVVVVASVAADSVEVVGAVTKTVVAFVVVVVGSVTVEPTVVEEVTASGAVTMSSPPIQLEKHTAVSSNAVKDLPDDLIFPSL